jgi:SOS-response transcriptional repressor LexA
MPNDPIDPDLLIQLVARAEMQREDSPFYTDERFIEWLGRDLASPERRREGWPAEKLDAMARRLFARVTARRAGITLAADRLRAYAVESPGTVEQLFADAPVSREAPRLDLAAAAGTGRAIWDEPCEEWVQVPPELPAGKYIALPVAGESMEPLLHAGDTVLVKLGPTVGRESVILARLPDDGYVVKRVGRVTRRTLQLLSMNEAFEPIEVPRAERTIVGTVVLRWCPHERGRRR